MKKYILSIDQGTTSSRAILFDRNGNIAYQATRLFDLIFPKPGWVECDPYQVYLSVVDCINEVLVYSHIDVNDVDCVGITNQRETTIIWDRQTGKPVYNAIVWQSRQTLEICEKYEEYSDLMFKKTGLRLNPYFSASKIRYILDKIPNGQARAEKGELQFGTIDTWLIYMMSKNHNHYTDITNASRTLLFNIFTKKWDEELLKIWNIPLCILPEVKPSSYDFGEVATIGNQHLHINGVAGDQQAALFGQNCFHPRECKNTYGTGCFLLMNIGDKPILSNNGLITTVAWEIDGKVTYALEGSVFMGGALVQWLRDSLCLIKKSSESETLARSVEDTAGVYIVPAFTGLGAPYWDDEARGCVFGLTRGATKAHLVRACLDAIDYQVYDCITAMEAEIGGKITSLRVDGGASANEYLMQFQSDILGVDILLPNCLETTALGAAFLAGLNSGFYKNLEDITECHKIKKTYHPYMNEETKKKLLNGWKSAINSARSFKPERE